MKHNLFESYGVLAHEKRPVYSDTVPASDAYNIITVEIPDEYPISENASGETLIDINGKTYMLYEVLTNNGDAPCLKWFDGDRHHRIMLKVL